MYKRQQFNLSEIEKKEAIELVKKLKNSDDFKSIMNKEKELKTKLDEINKLEDVYKRQKV